MSSKIFVFLVTLHCMANLVSTHPMGSDEQGYGFDEKVPLNRRSQQQDNEMDSIKSYKLKRRDQDGPFEQQNEYKPSEPLQRRFVKPESSKMFAQPRRFRQPESQTMFPQYRRFIQPESQAMLKPYEPFIAPSSMFFSPGRPIVQPESSMFFPPSPPFVK